MFGNLSYPACSAHAPYCHLWPVRPYNIFPHCLMKDMTFEKKKNILNVKCVFWFSLHLLSETLLILIRIERNMIKHSVLLAQYFSDDRRMRCAGHVARTEERRGAYRLLVGKPERKRHIWRPRRRWEDNIKMDLQEVECGGMDWIDMA